jgi:hypothetical protein
MQPAKAPGYSSVGKKVFKWYAIILFGLIQGGLISRVKIKKQERAAKYSSLHGGT